MIEPEPVMSGLPVLDRMDDPRGGAPAWALLAVVMALVASVTSLIIFL